MHPPVRSSRMWDQKYGSRYVERATSTAPRRAASSEKNQTPGSPSELRTYVRTFVSANSDLEDVQKAYNAGADEYLVIPYDPMVLEAKVERLTSGAMQTN
mgnify:CR=1 FL=1